jgi:hypothetical protein
VDVLLHEQVDQFRDGLIVPNRENVAPHEVPCYHGVIPLAPAGRNAASTFEVILFNLA